MCEFICNLGLLTDSTAGDGLIASLQGLLLNFKLWGNLNINTKVYLLRKVSTFVSSGQGKVEVLFRSVGVQRLLDIMQQHCVYNGRINVEEGWSKVKAMELLDAVHDLLSLTISAALQHQDTSGREIIPELQCVLLLLEETSSNDVAERLLRIISDMRFTHSKLLAHTMQHLRFNETMSLHLLCDPAVPFSIEVRRNTLLIVLWCFSEVIGNTPSELVSMKHCFHMLHSRGQHNTETGGTFFGGEAGACSTVKQSMKSVEKMWVNMNMLMAELGECLNSVGDWLMPTEYGECDMLQCNVADVLDIAFFDGPLGTLSPLLSIPLIATFLPKIQQRAQLYDGTQDLEGCQRVLMSLSVLLKTDEAQTCVLSLLPDISWMKHLVVAAVVCEEHRRYLHSFVVISQNDFAKTSDYDISTTCIELALDTLAQVMTFKICYHGQMAWESIQILQHLIKSTAMSGFDNHFSRRFCTLCIQKLSRLSIKTWRDSSLATISNLMVLIEGNQYCGNELIVNRENDGFAMCTCESSRGKSVDLLQYDEMSQPPLQSDDERQLLFFLFDFIAGFRRAGERQGAAEREVALFLPVLRIMSGCLMKVSDVSGDRISVELLAIISYISEHWLFFEEDGLRRIVLGLLAEVKMALGHIREREKLKEPGDMSSLVKRYSDLVVTISQFFVQLRYVYSEGLPLHVISTVESFRYYV